MCLEWADALITHMLTQDETIGVTETVNPVVLECFDGYLSATRGSGLSENARFMRPSGGIEWLGG